MDEEDKIKEQLSQVPFQTLLGIEKTQQQQIAQNQRQVEALPKKLKGGPEVRDARKPLPKNNQLPRKKNDSRDPRFDTTAGDLNITKFYKSFDFIGQLKQKEMTELHKASRKLDPESKQKIKQMIGKSKDELIKREEQLKKQKTFSKLKKANFHPKKSQIKEELLKEKFDQLEATGKLDAYVKTKKKVLAKKLDYASKKIKR